MLSMFINGDLITPTKAVRIADLRSLDNDTWYPYRIRSTGQGITQLTKVSVFADLDSSGSPSYGSHGSKKGVFATMTFLAAEFSWGVRTEGWGYILDENNNYVSDNKKCIAVKLSNNQLGFFLYLRGGLQYKITFNADLVGTFYANGLTQNDETYNPVTVEPNNDPSLIDLKSKLGG